MKHAGRAREHGAQLLELALVLPLLLILAVGILDFGTAYNLKQILNNAAREGARLGASQSALDLTCLSGSCAIGCGGAGPCTVQALCNDVVTYLWQARVDLRFLGFPSGFPSSPPPCPAPTAATLPGNCPTPPSVAYTWVYPSGTTACGTGLTIERKVPVPNATGTGVILSTRITLNYPYSWLYGFNNVVGLFGANYSGTISIVTNSMMADLN